MDEVKVEQLYTVIATVAICRTAEFIQQDRTQLEHALLNSFTTSEVTQNNHSRFAICLSIC